MASFAVKVQEDTTFSTVKSVLLPETESCEAQLVLGFTHAFSHAFSHFYSWNIKTTGQPVNSEKPNCWDKINTFIRKGVVLWQYILQVMKESKVAAHKYTNTSAHHLISV